MTEDNSYIQIELEEKSQFEAEFLLSTKETSTTISEIKSRQDNFDNRVIALEQQQLFNVSSLSTMTESLPIVNSNRDVSLGNVTKEEIKRSTCFMCDLRNKNCVMYFDDLYNFDKKEINTTVGADANRLKCPCGHLIRIHKRNPSSTETNLPSFATPPIGQFLYEEVVPPIVQDWIWSFKKNKSNDLNQPKKGNKED